MSRDRISVLISAEPGLLRDSINTILQSYSFVNVVCAVAGKHPSLDVIEQYHPEVVIIDCSTSIQYVELLRILHTIHEEIKCVAITETFQASRLVFENGAHSSLIKGFNSQDLKLALLGIAAFGQSWPAPVTIINEKN